jgi:CheY-like chemotaxis protein
MITHPSGLVLEQGDEMHPLALDRLEEKQMRDVPPEVFAPRLKTTKKDKSDPPEEPTQPAEDAGVSTARARDIAPAGYVMTVDDERDIRTALRDLLADEGYEVLEAADGVEALRSLQATQNRYVVLLDYLMPRMNGLEVLRAVSSDPVLMQRHAFILITANILSLQDEVRALLSQHGIPLLTKPFHWKTVIQAVEAANLRLASGD